MKMPSPQILVSLALLVPLAAGGAACGVSLSAAGSGVRLTRVEPGPGCEELGDVYGSGGGGIYTDAEFKLRSAQNDLRNRAAELGADYVVMDVASGDGASTSISGRALRCDDALEVADGPPPAPAAPPGAPPAVAAQSPEQRLRTLKDLLDKGLITQDEHDRRRREILDAL